MPTKPQFIYYSDSDALDIIFSDGRIENILRNYHRNFDVIVKRLTDEHEVTENQISELINYQEGIGSLLQALSPHISRWEENIYYRNEKINAHLMEFMLRLYATGKPYLGTYLKFIDNIAQNPSSQARDDIYRWVAYLNEIGKPLILTEDGTLVCHMEAEADNGEKQPIVVINGENTVEELLVNGETSYAIYPEEAIGSIIEMARTPELQEIQSGAKILQVGYWNGRKKRGMYRVEVDPKDVICMITGRTYVTLIHQSKHLMVKKIQITNIDKEEPPAVIPQMFGAGWFEEEFEQWNNLCMGSEKEAYSLEAQGYSFEESIRMMRK
ncbi:MAG: hypothetical protein H9W81_01055 [Enterococcus sp.]|nr:hypothetical protein [Enterococcus sp.]